MILFYRVLTNFLYPFLFLLVLIRIFLKKEDPKRFKEKILVNYFDIKKSKNLKLLWFHAASIGEFKSIIPLIKKIKSAHESYEILITTNTLSSSILAKKDLKKFNNIHHRFMPFDINYLIENFLDAWKPEKIFLVDSEIWPNLILKAKEKKIPLALINARITKRSFKKWLFFLKTAKKIFSSFDLCLCSNKETVKFLKKFDAKNIKYEGNLKFINEINRKELYGINSSILPNLRFWVAASTHKEEDIFCLKTHIEIKKKYNDIITIIIPRHLDRTNNIKKLSLSLNLKPQLLNDGDKILNNKEIIIVNSFGVLQKYFNYAKSVFIGKSIIKRLKKESGQNPIDAAKLGCKIYHGPYVYNFQEIYELLKKNNISKMIKDYKELSRLLITDLKVIKKEKNNKYAKIINLEQDILLKTIRILYRFLKYENK